MQKFRLPLVASALVALFGAMNASAAAPEKSSTMQHAVGPKDDYATFQALLYTEDEFDEFTVIDANDDGYTWEYYDDEATARLRANSDKTTAKDDWLISPGIELKAGNEYRITLDMRARKNDKPETFELKIGKSATVAGMTTTIISPTECINPEGYRYVKFITVEEDGVYYIGTHAMSEPAMSYFYFDYLAVSAPISVNAPAAVSDITFSPDIDGEACVKISFTAPSTTVAGEALSENISVDILRDDNWVTTLKNIAPGATKTYYDWFSDYDDTEADPTGYHTWTILPSNTSGIGKRNSGQVYVGINKPGAPKNAVVTTTDNVGEVTITWEAPTVDVDGYPVNPEKITYTITEVAGSESEAIVSGLTDLTYTYQAVAEGEQQDFKRYMVTACSKGGTGGYTTTDMIPVGAPFEFPFHESISGGTVDTLLGIYSLAGTPSWYRLKDGNIDGVSAQDSDNGFIGMYAEASGVAGMLYTGEISIENAENPVVSFYTYAFDAEDANNIEVSLTVDDEREVVKTVCVSDLMRNGETGWYKVTVPVSSYIGKTVELGIACYVTNYTWTVLDNIAIEEGAAADLTVSAIAVPESVTSGQDFEITVLVTNNGVKTAKEYQINLYRDDELYLTADCVDIDYEATQKFTFKENFNVTEADAHTYYVKAEIEGDANTADNTTETGLAALRGINMPTVREATAEELPTETALSWLAPQTSSTVLSYNIYRDHVLIGNTTELTFSDTTPASDLDSYKISALYEEGESRGVSPQLSGVNAVSYGKVSILGGNSEITVNGQGEGRLVIADTTGRLLNNSEVELPFRLSVEPGIYIVTYGSRTLKLVVK